MIRPRNLLPLLFSPPFPVLYKRHSSTVVDPKGGGGPPFITRHRSRAPQPSAPEIDGYLNPIKGKRHAILNIKFYGGVDYRGKGGGCFEMRGGGRRSCRRPPTPGLIFHNFFVLLWGSMILLCQKSKQLYNLLGFWINVLNPFGSPVMFGRIFFIRPR
jgi:hypothetical protein